MTIVDRVVERVRRMPPAVADGALGLGIGAVGITGLSLWNTPTSAASLSPGTLGILAVSALAVTLRRTNPFVAYAPMLLAGVGGLLWTSDYNSTRLTALIVL